MPAWIACQGSTEKPVNVKHYPSQPNGLGWTQAKSFGDCSVCGRVSRLGAGDERKPIGRHKDKRGNPTA